MKPRILEVRTKILKKNDEIARAMRDEFIASGMFVCNFVSSPGTGKTSLLRETMRRLLARENHVAAIVGDLETDRDAQALAESGAPVKQIMTHGLCHLEADMVRAELASWGQIPPGFLFIENVGNLVCPTSWDLGESLRVALLSVAEGEDKPLKYPGLFNSADVAIITKTDLAEPCDFQRDQALDHLRSVRPGIPVLEVSSKTGQGMDAWIEFLEEQRKRFLSAGSASC